MIFKETVVQVTFSNLFFDFSVLLGTIKLGIFAYLSQHLHFHSLFSEGSNLQSCWELSFPGSLVGLWCGTYLLLASNQVHRAHISRPCQCQQAMIQGRPSFTKSSFVPVRGLPYQSYGTYFSVNALKIGPISRVLEFVCD